ncbi:hypothetical protein ACWGIU_35875, partial [Streptomyces sp. NPDC054840]
MTATAPAALPATGPAAAAATITGPAAATAAATGPAAAVAAPGAGCRASAPAHPRPHRGPAGTRRVP